MSTTIFSHALRLIVCANCGAPIEVDLAGGQSKCRYCGALNLLARRDESKDLAVAEQMRASQMSEAQRLDILRSQDHRPMTVPESLLRYLEGGKIAAHHVQAALADWRWNCKEVQGGAPLAEQDRLFHLTLLLTRVVDQRHERALLENALEVLPDARHRQVLRSKLAHDAVLAGDLEAARDWLKPLNPRPTDLHTDTAYRLAVAYLAVAEKDPDRVLGILGHRPGDVPIAEGYDDEAEILRADAIERKGGASVAIEQLRHLMRADVSRIASMREAVHEGASLGLCAVSFPAAFSSVWQEIDRETRPKSLTSLGCVGAGCILPVAGTTLVVAAAVGALGSNPAVVVNAIVHPLIWLVILPLVIIAAVLRSRKKTKRLRDEGKLTFARVVGCTRRAVQHKSSVSVYQDVVLDVELDGRLYRTKLSVQQDEPLPPRTYPVLVDPTHFDNMVLKIKPLGYA